MGNKFFPFRVEHFSEGRGAGGGKKFKELPPLKVYLFS